MYICTERNMTKGPESNTRSSVCTHTQVAAKHELVSGCLKHSQPIKFTPSTSDLLIIA